VAVEGKSNHIEGGNDITLGISGLVSTEPVTTDDGTTVPTGFKYLINITGTPSTKFDNSAWRLVQIVKSKFNNTATYTSTATSDGVFTLDWVSTILLDGVSTPIIHDVASSNYSIPNALEEAAYSFDRDVKYIVMCGKYVQQCGFSRFNSSFYWDSTASVDEVKATTVLRIIDPGQEYTLIDGGVVSAARLERPPFAFAVAALASLALF
jgi:hypothetical protein